MRSRREICCYHRDSRAELTSAIASSSLRLAVPSPTESSSARDPLELKSALSVSSPLPSAVLHLADPVSLAACNTQQGFEPVNGACISTRTDPRNCGALNNACPASYNGVGTAICNAGRCQIGEFDSRPLIELSADVTIFPPHQPALQEASRGPLRPETQSTASKRSTEVEGFSFVHPIHSLLADGHSSAHLHLYILSFFTP